MKVLLVLAVFISPYLFAEIMECNSFEDIKSQTQKGDVLFLEIDEVLIKSKQEVGSVAFHRYLKEEMLKEGFEPEEIINRIYPIWVKIQKKIQTELASLNIVNFFKQIRSLNIPIFGLTHRGPALSLYTHEILHDLNLSFDDENLLNLQKLKTPLVSTLNGIFFFHPIYNKGKFLMKLTEDKKFKRIVCVDYELVNLVSMQQLADSKGISFLGLYYKNQDLNVSDYTVEIGKMQLKFLDQILPDNIANILIEN